jgi:hypothetical protein
MPAAPQLQNQMVSGHANPIQFQAVGQGQVATLNITGHTWDEEVLRHIITHTGSGGIQARLAGVLDGKGTVQADYDGGLPPYLNPPLIVAGVSGLMLFYVTPQKAFQVPMIIAKVHYESAVQGKVSWSMDVEMNSQAGVYLRPST